jgi:hypothetical protein
MPYFEAGTLSGQNFTDAEIRILKSKLPDNCFIKTETPKPNVHISFPDGMRRQVKDAVIQSGIFKPSGPDG